MGIKTFFSNLFVRLRGIEAKGSAFIKIAEADVKAAEAKGRIIAIDAANKAKAEVVAYLEKEASRVHAETDKIKADFDAILAKL